MPQGLVNVKAWASGLHNHSFAFHDSLDSLDVGRLNDKTWLAAGHQRNDSCLFFMGPFDDPFTPAVRLVRQSQRVMPYSVKFHQGTGQLSMVSCDAAHTIDERGNIFRRLSRDKVAYGIKFRVDADFREDYAYFGKYVHGGEEDDSGFGQHLDWLDPDTLAVSFTSAPELGRHAVVLWDVRTDTGFSARFVLSQRITGILSPSNTQTGERGHQLIVSTNCDINVFDTRTPRPNILTEPILRFPHVHEGSRLLYCVNSQGIIAAVDLHNDVQLYSIRTGRPLGALTLAPFKNPRPWRSKQSQSDSDRVLSKIRSISWCEDEQSGPVLLGCRDEEVFTWSWTEAKA